ncbi:MAG: iron dicitrate transport regulator FecR [Steroidobacteraceae bacterium]|nr:iron dicitrate transport regulator FecR [Steroidobacteraceae bacterium]
MFQEAAQAADVVRTQLARNAGPLAALGARLRLRPPRAVVTCARGSSDHAATYAKYLIESYTGVLTSKEGGALTVALCNTVDSPLMQLVDVAVPLHAGAETSVAATKSYIASLSAIAQLLACWTDDQDLLRALPKTPDLLARAWDCDWNAVVEALRGAVNLFVVARGFGLGVAQEAALKLKETCGLHAEAFSSAEVKHGPMALVRAGFPVLMFTQDDDTRAGIAELAAEFAARGARVLLSGAQASGALTLPTVQAPPVIEPLLAIQSFYRAADALARARGLDPDRPPHLNKVTETL